MSPNQSALLVNLVESFLAQIPAADKTKLGRTQFVDHVKSTAPDIYAKILNTIVTQGLFEHLKTIYLDRPEYWSELILELIWARETNNLEITPETQYNHWKNYKLQRVNKQLMDQSN